MPSRGLLGVAGAVVVLARGTAVRKSPVPGARSPSRQRPSCFLDCACARWREAAVRARPEPAENCNRVSATAICASERSQPGGVTEDKQVKFHLCSVCSLREASALQ